MNLANRKSFDSKWLHAYVCILALFAGCTSIESTMVTRDESNQTWERHNCLNGVPITVKVPTHLKLYVFDKHYLEVVPCKDKAGNDTAQMDVRPVCMDLEVRDFANEFMYTDKIFVVDFKRPPAGVSNLTVDMTKDQYIARVQHDIQENTIEQVSGLLGAFIGSGGLKSAANQEGQGKDATNNGPALTEVKSLVAVGIFEIESPDFEQKVKQFIDCHMNKSHDAWVVPPCVEGINRVGIRPCDNIQSPYPPVPLCSENGECSSPWNGDAAVSTTRKPNADKSSVK